jgi:GTP-binding protein
MIMEIIQSRYLISSPSFDKAPAPDRPEFAFIGRSNVGKSSVINMLCNNTKLAKTSATPGKTQLINHFLVKSIDKKSGEAASWYLVDLPGYGYAKRSKTDRRRWEQMIEGYVRKRHNLVTLFVLIDSRHAPQKIDLDFVNRLGQWQTPFALVFTKTDKNKPQATIKNVNLFMESLQQTWHQPPMFFMSSAVTRSGRTEILEFINELTKN